MFESIIFLFCGIVIGIYIVSQISKSCDKQNQKLIDNMNEWESSQKVKYTWREDEKNYRQK